MICHQYDWNGHLPEVLSRPLSNPLQVWLPMGNGKKILKLKKPLSLFIYILLFTFLLCVHLWKCREYIITVAQTYN